MAIPDAALGRVALRPRGDFQAVELWTNLGAGATGAVVYLLTSIFNKNVCRQNFSNSTLSPERFDVAYEAGMVSQSVSLIVAMIFTFAFYTFMRR